MPADLRGQIPTDLPEVARTWTDWPLPERARAAKSISGCADIERQSAVAITLNEQPGKIPVNNCCGIMCQGAARPWGWTDSAWAGCTPVGYALIREGAGGKLGVFLAFKSATDSLAFLVRKVHDRGVVTAEAYADKWVAVESLRNQSISGFNAMLARVQSAWEESGPQPVATGPVLKRGSRGEDVSRLQGMLVAHGFSVVKDGDFGPKTEQAVRQFQAGHKDQNGQPLVSDGIVGAKTWWALSQP